MIDLKFFCDLKKKKIFLTAFKVKKYISILCIIVLIILVGLDNNKLVHLMGSLWDGMTTNNIGMWLSVK